MLSGSIYDFAQSVMRKARTDNPFELAKELGIIVEYKKFEEIKGMYYVALRCHFIFLNDELDDEMARVVLAHEIGHHLLHRHLATSQFQEFGLFDVTAKPEMEANIFAANILISDDNVEMLAEDNYTSEQIANILKVPHQLLLIKMKDMNSRGYKFNVAYIPRGDFLGR